LRLEAVQTNSWVDFAFLLNTPAEEFIAALKPDVVVKGKEHENLWNPEAEVVASYGGALQFGSGETVFSASNLLRQELSGTEGVSVELPNEFAERHAFTLASLAGIIQNAQSVRVCVIGDTVVDEYVTCDPLGMSQEDPTIVVAPVGSDRFLGGAAIVAAHCAGLGAKVDFFSVTGDDALKEFVSDKLNEYQVTAHLMMDETRPTTLKQRFRASSKTLLRVNHLRQHGIRRDLQKNLLSRLIPLLEDLDVLVFSDFNYGCLPQILVDEITSACRARRIVLLADSQCSSQIGDISRVKGVDVLTPTELEARVSTRNHEDGLVVLAEKLRQQASAKNILLKLGAEGVLIHPVAASDDSRTDQLPSFNRAPKDTSGAGDSLLAAVALTMALGGSIWQAAYLGSVAAACQVSRMGNVPLTSRELLRAISSARSPE
jgi:rfaE bifunctional protein kinase chain/domain